MTTIGYARVGTTDQDLDIQVVALKREGCTTIRSEKRSGTSTANREELRTVLDFLRKGDVLTVHPSYTSQAAKQPSREVQSQ
jgi:DNA invertase Pin-like site-specific DNA recombinase